jgi:hypothetical protein
MSDQGVRGVGAARLGPAATLLVLAAAPLLTWMVGQTSSPPPRLDPDLGVPIGESLRAPSMDAPPMMDGIVDAAWQEAPPLVASLHYGLHGNEPAGTVELRSLYDEANVYFLARWSATIPGGEPDVWRNLLTVHWRLVDSGKVSGQSTGSEGLACTVGCHTATADGQGLLVGMRAETIPPGL